MLSLNGRHEGLGVADLPLLKGVMSIEESGLGLVPGEPSGGSRVKICRGTLKTLNSACIMMVACRCSRVVLVLVILKVLKTTYL